MASDNENMEMMRKFESGFNEGVLWAVQMTTSKMIRLLNQHNTWMLKPDRDQAVAMFKMAARSILEKRKIVPTSYQVMMGKAEDVELDFNMY